MKLVLLLSGISLLFSADFSIRNIMTETYNSSPFYASVRAIGYVVLSDPANLKDIGSACDYFDYVEVYEVVESFKGKLPKYIIVKKVGEYCGKFKLERFSTYKKSKLSVIGLKKKGGFYIMRDPFDEIPLTDETKNEIYRFEALIRRTEKVKKEFNKKSNDSNR